MVATTSGTTSFNLRVDEIIDLAYQRLGSEYVTGLNSKSARMELNLLLIDMNNRGVPLSKVEKVSVPLLTDVISYDLLPVYVDILDMVCRDENNLDFPLQRYSLAEYNHIPNKVKGSTRPTHYMLDRQNPIPTVYVWPAPMTDNNSLEFYAIARTEDISAAYQYVDISYRYLPCIISGLAHRLAYNRGAGEEFAAYRAELKAEYEQLLNNALLEDRERVDFFVTPYPYMWK